MNTQRASMKIPFNGRITFPSLFFLFFCTDAFLHNSHNLQQHNHVIHRYIEGKKKQQKYIMVLVKLAADDCLSSW